MNWNIDWGVVFAVAACIALTAFILIYALVPWSSSRYGQSIMATKTAMLFVALAYIFNIEALEAVGWFFLTIVIAFRVGMLWHDVKKRPTGSTTLKQREGGQ